MLELLGFRLNDWGVEMLERSQSMLAWKPLLLRGSGSTLRGLLDFLNFILKQF